MTMMNNENNSDNDNNQSKEGEDDTASEAFSISSDAAVAVPKQPSSSRKKRLSRKLSFGTPSKAALAALAGASDDDEDDPDIEALLPKPPPVPPPKAKRHGLQIRRSRTLDSTGYYSSSNSTLDVSRSGLSLKRNGTTSPRKKPQRFGLGGSGTFSNRSIKSAGGGAPDSKPVQPTTHAATVAAIPKPNLEKDCEKNEQEEDEDSGMTTEEDGFDDASDAAVAMPKHSSSSGGRRRSSLLHGTASKAAAAVLASLEESEHPPEEQDIEALLPSPKQKKQQQNERQKVRRTSTGPSFPRHSTSLQLKRTLSMNGQGEGGADSGDELLQKQQGSSKVQPTKSKSPKHIADGKKKALPGKNHSFDKMSHYTATSRTGSLELSDVEDAKTDIMNVDDDARSNTSRYTARTHRTLKEIREEKNRPAKPLPSNHSPPKIWCFGLSRCTWIIIIITGLVGFGVGFLVPLMQTQNRPDALQVPLAPSDPSEVNPIGDYNTPNPNVVIQTPPLGEEPLTSSTSSSNHSPPKDSSILPISQDEEEETPEEEQKTVEPQVEEEEEDVVDSIDVWQLFGTDNEVLPQASAFHLASTSTFREDHLQQAARLFVQGTIQRNIRKPKVAIEKKSATPVEGEIVIPFVDTPLQAFDGEMPYPTTSARRTSDQYPQGDVTRWEDLLVRLGIQESDTLQWDQEQDVLYVAHGKRIAVIDTKTGSLRATIPLPPPALVEDTRDSWLMMSMMESDAWEPAPPQPFIEQLLLTTNQDYLIVIVSDYTKIHNSKVKPLLKDSLVTQLFTFRATHQDNVTEYQLIDDPHPIHGRLLYAAQATTNQHIHVVTSSSIDTARLLQDPLERLYYPDRLDAVYVEEVYVEEVLNAAKDKYIPLYMKRLLDEIDGLQGDVSLLPLTRWITGESATSEEERQLEHLVTAQEHLQELVVVTSFSIVETNDPSATATLRQAGSSSSTTTMTSISTGAITSAFLGPPSMQVIGSTDTHLTLGVPGYEWADDADAGGGKVLREATQILQWELGTLSLPGTSNRAATRFQGMATIPGRLIQTPRQSTHRHGADLRLATVLTSQWKVEDAQANSQPMVESSVHKSFLHVLDQRTLQPRSGSPLQLFKGEPALLSSVTFLDVVAYAFPLEPASTATANNAAIQVVKLPHNPEDRADNTLKLTGSISPVPQGFSRHLHELANSRDGKKLLLSIGHNTTDSGLQSGWMLTIWDVSDQLAPKVIVQRSLEEPNTITTWKPQTFRVTPNGLVILPMTVEHIAMRNEEENMKGFVVLDVSGTVIKELADIEINQLIQLPHSEVVMSAGECVPGVGGCGLEGKSLWQTGDDGSFSLLTVEGANVQFTKLTSDEVKEGWSLSLP